MHLPISIYVISELIQIVRSTWCLDKNKHYSPLFEHFYTVCKLEDLLNLGDGDVTITTNLGLEKCINSKVEASVQCAKDSFTITTTSGALTNFIGGTVDAPTSINVKCDSNGYFTLGGSQILDISCAEASPTVCNPECTTATLSSTLPVTSPLGPEGCILAGSFASVVCNLDMLSINAGPTQVLTGPPITFVAECVAGGLWQTLDGNIITELVCENCVNNANCNPADLELLDLDILVQAPLGSETCISSLSLATVSCPLYSFTITTTGGDTTKPCGTTTAPSILIVECTPTGWVFGANPITAISCEPINCIPECTTASLSTTLTVTSPLGTEDCILAGSAASVVCNLDMLTVTAGATQVLTGPPITFVAECVAGGSWQTLNGNIITALACENCVNSASCDPADLELLDVDISVTAPLGLESCIASMSSASVTCDMYSFTISTAGGDTTRLGGTTAAPSILIVECTPTGWALGTNPIIAISCEPVTCIPECTREISSLTLDTLSAPQFTFTVCSDQCTVGALVGDTLLADCPDDTDVLQFRRGNFNTGENSITLTCTSSGWQWPRPPPGASVVTLNGGQRRLRCR